MKQQPRPMGAKESQFVELTDAYLFSLLLSVTSTLFCLQCSRDHWDWDTILGVQTTLNVRLFSKLWISEGIEVECERSCGDSYRRTQCICISGPWIWSWLWNCWAHLTRTSRVHSIYYLLKHVIWSHFMSPTLLIDSCGQNSSRHKTTTIQRMTGNLN